MKSGQTVCFYKQLKIYPELNIKCKLNGFVTHQHQCKVDLLTCI